MNQLAGGEFQKRRREFLNDIQRLGRDTEEMLGLSMEGYDRFRVEGPQEAIGRADGLDREAERLTAELVRLSEGASGEQRGLIQSCLGGVHHLQLIADCCRDFSERVIVKITEGLLFSDKAFREVKELYAEVRSLLHDAVTAFARSDGELSRAVEKRGRVVDEMSNNFSSEHEKRLISGVCAVRSSAVFLDMLDALKRIAGHAVSMACGAR